MTTACADDIVHQPHRLKIMAALDAEPDAGALEFARLKAIAGATDGNLGAHLATLDGAGYVRIDKQPAGKRFRTLVSITPAGRRAFLGHLAYLEAIVAAARERGG